MSRPPPVSHDAVVDSTDDDNTRTVALALATISQQLDRVIELLEAGR